MSVGVSCRLEARDMCRDDAHDKRKSRRCVVLAAGGATYLAIPNHRVGAGSFRAEGACGCGGGVGVGVVSVIGGHGGYGGRSWLLACVFFFLSTLHTCTCSIVL